MSSNNRSYKSKVGGLPVPFLSALIYLPPTFCRRSSSATAAVVMSLNSEFLL